MKLKFNLKQSLVSVALLTCALQTGPSIIAASAGNLPGVYTGFDIHAPITLKDLIGENTFVFETASRVVRNRNPDFLNYPGVSCSRLLAQTQGDYFEMIRQLSRPELSAFTIEWGNRLSAVVRTTRAIRLDPENKQPELRKELIQLLANLAIDVTLPSDQIRFLDSTAVFVVPPRRYLNSAAWTGFGIAEESAPEALPETASFPSRNRPLKIASSPKAEPPKRLLITWTGEESPAVSIPVKVGPPTGKPTPVSPNQILTQIMSLRDEYVLFMGIYLQSPKWKLDLAQRYFDITARYHQAIIDLSIAAPQATDPADSERFSLFSNTLAREALDTLPEDLADHVGKSEVWSDAGPLAQAYSAYSARIAQLRALAPKTE